MNKGRKKRRRTEVISLGPLVHLGYLECQKRGANNSLAGRQSLDLGHLEVFVLAVLSDHRLHQLFYRFYRLPLPDTYYRRVVGSGRADGQGDALDRKRVV